MTGTYRSVMAACVQIGLIRRPSSGYGPLEAIRSSLPAGSMGVPHTTSFSLCHPFIPVSARVIGSIALG
jgi:hypothetical protein